MAHKVKNPPQCGRPGFDPWVGKRIPWTEGTWWGSGEGGYSPWGHKELDTTKRLSTAFVKNKN